MAKWIWGLDPLAASRLGRRKAFLPSPSLNWPAWAFGPQDPRVQAELARLAGSCRLQRAALLALARQIARQLR